MKKTIRRFVTLMLTLIMVLSLATFVSAASSVYWTDSSGDHTAYANATSTYDKTIYLSGNSTFCTIDYVGQSGMVAFTGTYSRTFSAKYGETVPYQTYLTQAMQKEGVHNSITFTVNESTLNGNTYVTVPPGSSIGTYGVGFRYRVKNGEWQILNGTVTVFPDSTGNGAVSPAAVGLTGDGTFSDAPTGYWTLTYYKVS